MRKYIRILVLSIGLGLVSAPANQAHAVLPEALLKIIKEAVVKVINAADLVLQQLQNHTIWLQNAQKEIENALTKLKLDEIADWTEKQKEQYRKYYEELKKVKKVISTYQRIKAITAKQARLVEEYKNAWNLFSHDRNFSTEERKYMSKVYQGILDESVKNIDQISLVVKSLTTQMSDAQRIQIINYAADQVDHNYDDLRLFNRQNVLLSLQREKARKEVDVIRGLYNL